MAFSYFSTTRPDSLASAMTNVQTSVILADGSTFPDPALNGGVPYTVILAYGTDREEVVTVTAKPTATTLTVIRGEDGTPATTKNAGDVVVHGVSARDFQGPQQHSSNVVDPHGIDVSALVYDADPRLSDARAPLAHAASHQDGGADELLLAQDQVTGLPTIASDVAQAKTDITALQSGKAPLASPALTGNPTAPTPTAGDNDTSIATTAFVQTTANAKVANALGSSTTVAPSQSAVNTGLAGKAATSHSHSYAPAGATEIRTVNLGTISPGDEVTSPSQAKASEQVVFGASVVAPSSTYLLPVCFVDSATAWRVKVRNTTNSTTHTNVTVYVLLVRPG